MEIYSNVEVPIVEKIDKFVLERLGVGLVVWSQYYANQKYCSKTRRLRGMNVCVLTVYA